MGLIGKKTTMDDIAERLDISKNSVSLALNNKKGVSDELRKRVLETAREMGYGSYSAQTDSRDGCIILLVPEYLHNDSFFYVEIFWSVDHAIKKKKLISINAGISRRMERELVMPEFPTEMKIVGLMVIGVLGDEYVTKLKKCGYPMISVDIPPKDIDISCVCTANLNGGYLATEHLIAKGHTNIGFIGPVHFANSVYERYCGYRQAMMDHDLHINPNVCILGDVRNPERLDTIEVLEPYLDNLKERPTAWFCAGDRIAFAVITLLTAKGIRVPDEISIIGFDDIPLATMVLPQLTTIHIDRKLMGKMVVENLLNQPKDSDSLIIQIPGRLVQRDSVKSLL